MKKFFFPVLGASVIVVLAISLAFKAEPLKTEKASLMMLDECKFYLEGACTINGKAGTHCTANPGDCKKARSCEALSDLGIGTPTAQEIDDAATAHAVEMTVRGEICDDPVSWNASKQAAIDSYNSFYN